MVDVRALQIAGGLVVPGTDIDDSVWGDRPRGLTAGYTFEQGSGCARDPDGQRNELHRLHDRTPVKS
jgi:hypothetical protein